MKLALFTNTIGLASCFHSQQQIYQLNAVDVQGCWRDAFTRGIGEFPSDCKATEELFQYGRCIEKCQKGYESRGLYCENPHDALDRYFRGPGREADCHEKGDEIQAGRCFTKCQKGYRGLGPFCYSARCPEKFHFSCGAVCVPSLQHCTREVFELSKEGAHSLFKVISGNPQGGLEGLKKIVVHLLSWPLCRRVSENEPKEREGDFWVYKEGRVLEKY